MDDEPAIGGHAPRRLIRPGIRAGYDVVLKYPAEAFCPHCRGEALLWDVVDGRGHTHHFPHGATVIYVENGRGDIDTLVFVKRHRPGR